jgi:hypothetical protein
MIKEEIDMIKVLKKQCEFITFVENGILEFLMFSKDVERFLEGKFNIVDFSNTEYSNTEYSKYIKEEIIRCNIILVLDDEYSYLREGILKGKKLQFKHINGREWIDISIPEDERINSIMFSKNITYRVKPDIDTSWIVDGAYAVDTDGNIFQINIDDDFYILVDGAICFYDQEDLLKSNKKWEPKHGDIVYIVHGERGLPTLYVYDDFIADMIGENKEIKIHPYTGEHFWEK